MPSFICAKCGCVDNSATSDYWWLMSHGNDIMFPDEMKQYRNKPLCCECCKLVFNPADDKYYYTTGKWHDKFEKRFATKEDISASNKETGIIDFNLKYK